MLPSRLLDAQPGPRSRPARCRSRCSAPATRGPTWNASGRRFSSKPGRQRVLIDAGRGAAQRLFEIGQRDLLDRHRRALPDPPALRPHGGPAGRVAHELDLRPRQGAAAVGPAGHRRDGRPSDAGLSVGHRHAVEGRRLPRRRRAPGGRRTCSPAWSSSATACGSRRLPWITARLPCRPTATAWNIGAARRCFRATCASTSASPRHAKGADVMVLEVISPEVEARRAQVQDPQALERASWHGTSAPSRPARSSRA